MPCISGEKIPEEGNAFSSSHMPDNHHESVAYVLAYFPPILFSFSTYLYMTEIITNTQLDQIYNLVYFLKHFVK